MRTTMHALLALLVVLTVVACDAFVYTQRLDIPFPGMPAVSPGDAVRADQGIIGRVAAVTDAHDGARVQVDLKPAALPPRAVFLASTDPTGRTCLLVYTVPPTAHPARGPYWGARTQAELVLQLGEEQLDRAADRLTDWLVHLLGARPGHR